MANQPDHSSARLVVLAGWLWPRRLTCSWGPGDLLRDYQLYKTDKCPTSVGLRLEFWQKSLQFFAEAPVIGHGTGSTRGLFERAATGDTDSAARPGHRQSA